MAKARRGRGKPESFTDLQNAALREALRSLKERHPTQQGLADALGVVQQTAARLLNDRHTGFSFATATALARQLGFTGVDALLASKLGEPAAHAEAS